MSIYKRKLFNRGGPVSSRGVGITSGFVPVQKFFNGGEAEKIKSKYETTLDTLRGLDIVPEREPFDKLGANQEALLTLFGNLMSGKSYQGGLSGAFDIAGQSLQKAAPEFQEAIKLKRQYDATDPEASIKNLALSEALKPEPTPDITGTQVIDFVDSVDNKTKQKLIYFENGVQKEKVLGLAVGDEANAVKNVPRDIYDALNDDQQLKVLGLGGEDGISNVGSPVDVLNDKGEMQSVVTYVQDNQLKTKVLGSTTTKADSQIERMINATNDYIGKNVTDYPQLQSNFPEIFPPGQYIVNEEKVAQLKSKLNLNFLMKESEADKTISADEQAALDNLEFIRDTVTTPKINTITTNYTKAVERADDLAGAKSSLESFTPGAFADVRLEIGKIISLFVDPSAMSADMVALLEDLKIGNPVGGDVLDKFSSNLTLASAAGGALPGNLNTKEFNELKNTGLPLWTSKEGAELMIDIYQRNDEIAFDANRMLNDVNTIAAANAEPGVDEKFSIQYPNGKIEQFESYDAAVAKIEEFYGLESGKIISGNSDNYKEWNSIGDKLENLKKYDSNSLRLEGKNVRNPFSNETFDAQKLEAEGKLRFIGWGDGKGDPNDPNAKYPGQALYEYQTGRLWSGDEDGYDPKIHKIGTEIIMIWASPKGQMD